ncbi:GNAT family N-acetyltransferase [bacterium]|nr:GNAT family N-acetyltransferase [bacterium]RQV98457.1 MAG: N-acetyltransferase [bacterium]
MKITNNHISFKVDDILMKSLTSDTWDDFECLFGPKGAYAGCWCMWWRLSRKEFEKGQGEANRQAMKSIVQSGKIPGLITYDKDEPCGWCSVAPREHFSTLERSRVLKRIDNQEVWSIVCFFIKKNHRGKNLSLQLIQGALDYVKSQGGKIVEAYPTILKTRKAPPVSTFMGIPSVLERAGFKIVHKPSQSKWIMRYFIR